MMTKIDVVLVLNELMFQWRRQKKNKQMNRKIVNCDECYGGNSHIRTLRTELSTEAQSYCRLCISKEALDS